MNNIRYDLYEKEVKVICNDNTEIVGVFTDDFEDDKEIVVNGILIKYTEVKEMIEVKK